MGTIEQIKAEIERLKSELVRGACAAGIAMETNCKEEAYNEVLAFMDSLPVETASPELEAAANEYGLNARKGYPRVMDETDHYIRKAFIAGAEWQKQQDEQKCHGCFDRDEVFRQGMMKGAKEKEEEMMKDAIPAIVYFDFSDPGDVVCRKLSVNKTALSDALLKLDMNDVQNDGSDVKLIIVKKDEVR